jgi:hypothetical protein
MNVDEEIDRLVDKFSNDLKVKLKKVVERSEKAMLKQYALSQKTTKDKKDNRDEKEEKPRKEDKKKDAKLKGNLKPENNHKAAPYRGRKVHDDSDTE